MRSAYENRDQAVDAESRQDHATTFANGGKGQNTQQGATRECGNARDGNQGTAPSDEYGENIVALGYEVNDEQLSQVAKFANENNEKCGTGDPQKATQALVVSSFFTPFLLVFLRNEEEVERSSQKEHRLKNQDDAMG